MKEFLSGTTVYALGRAFTVVRGKPDSDGDITVTNSEGIDMYLNASTCSEAKPCNVNTQETPVQAPQPTATKEHTAQSTLIEGNHIMSNQQNSSRRTVSVTLLDRDVNLEGKDAIVLELGKQVSEGSTQELIQELIMDPANKVAEAMKAHNDKRATVVNREVLNRTGNKVKLEPVKMRELHWDIV